MARSGIHVSRNARPDHAEAAVRHALAPIDRGVPRSMMLVMARGCVARGLTDAAFGYEQVALAMHAGEASDAE